MSAITIAPAAASTQPPPAASGSAASPAQRIPAAPDRARLSLDPATPRSAGIHGGWWPRSQDAAAELPGLIAELSARAGRVSRVALQADAFANIPHQLHIGGRKVPVAWFRYMNKHTAIVTMSGRDDLVLLVIPPSASPAAAAQALGLAASGRHARSPEAILAAAGITAGRPGLGAVEARAADLLALARLDDDGAPCGRVRPRSQPAARSRQ